MGFWEIIYLVWLCLGLGVILANHGKERTGTYNFWTSLICNMVYVFILWKGGFFR